MRVCVRALLQARSPSRVTINMSERVCCGTDELLYSDWWEAHSAGGGFSVSNMHYQHRHAHTDFQRAGKHLRPKTPFSHTKPNKDKWIYFIFQRRLFASLLYEPEMYIVNEASVGGATGGACQSQAQSSTLKWWPASGLDAAHGDRSNTFITKQQSVY